MEDQDRLDLISKLDAALESGDPEAIWSAIEDGEAWVMGEAEEE